MSSNIPDNDCVDGSGGSGPEWVDIIMAEIKDARLQQENQLKYYRHISQMVGGGFLFLVALTIAIVDRKDLFGTSVLVSGAVIAFLVLIIHMDINQWRRLRHRHPRDLCDRYANTHPSFIRQELMDIACREFNYAKQEIRYVAMFLLIEIVLVGVFAYELFDVYR